MSLQCFDVVLVPFPFTDLSSSKLRPAIVVYLQPNRGDLVVVFISSRQLGQLAACRRSP